MSPRIDPAVVAWVSTNLIPFEADLRSRLRRLCSDPAEVDDLVQDVYYRILKTESIAHVREPRAFLMQTAKNILIDRFRREAVVSIESVANLDELDVPETCASTERIAMARLELTWIVGLVARLPERCKQVFCARRIYGMSQAETAVSLGISENIVEKEVIKGGGLLSEMIKSHGVTGAGRTVGDLAALPPPVLRKRHV